MASAGPAINTAPPVAGESPWLGEVVEQSWRKLGGKVPRDRIHAVAAEAAAGFAEARVGAFLPILIERKVRAALAPEVGDAGAAPAAAPIADLPLPRPPMPDSSPGGVL